MDPTPRIIRQGLDIEYCGVEIDIPSWDVLVTKPLITEMNGLLMSDWQQDRLQEQGHWGLILKLGARAFEKEIEKGKPIPYQVGDWVMFHELHPQARRINESFVYFVPDNKLICKITDLIHWECYHLAFNDLQLMRERAAETRKKWADEAQEKGRM